MFKNGFIKASITASRQSLIIRMLPFSISYLSVNLQKAVIRFGPFTAKRPNSSFQDSIRFMNMTRKSNDEVFF